MNSSSMVKLKREMEDNSTFPGLAEIDELAVEQFNGKIVLMNPCIKSKITFVPVSTTKPENNVTLY